MKIVEITMVSTDYQWYLSSMGVMVEAISFSGRWLRGVHSMKDLVQGEDGDHAWFTVEMRLAPFNFLTYFNP